MPIDEKFVENLEVTGKTLHSDGENKHFIWGNGRTDGEAFSNDDVKAAYEARGEEQVPLGIHGTTVAVDWDSCVAAGSCMSVCPVQTFQWYRTEKDIPAKDVVGATFDGTGLTEQDERLDYTDKSMPIREHDCTQCMACQEACPTHAILIEPSYQEFHEKADGSYVKMESSSVNPHAHD
ncbi:ferredoxin family protein [Candidatus Nitrosopumilus sp. SW]|uniref:4Fe-4S dicluster domain-containing protein n=1 Tax=Candidatus Nitrosopumilus sp. SW TaxID=2508726 RepID=UPI001153155D|nr:ferredoxin family protein [Candidatus Nitrosopumilus sp. SW]QDI88700.1 ferredoxin family protein [Candidatus Nitrosopumilus sp. SW]